MKREYRRLNDLMQHRVRDVLLLSTLYDAYILQEDGHLTEKVYHEYRELQLSSAPRFSHVDSPEDAIRALEVRRFDLLLIVSGVRMNTSEFARLVHERYPDVAVVLLSFDTSEHEELGELRREIALEGIFSWSGDARILLALLKCVEDARNVDNDIKIADVPVILLVEDSIRFYSSYLAALYPELMNQSQSLFSEGRNRMQKLLKMRTRPKILLAQDYEQACLLADRYRKNLLALISDVGFPMAGKHTPEAGLSLVRRIREIKPELPVLLQSADRKHSEAARECDLEFVHKGSSRLIKSIRNFLRDYLGFGPFIFRNPEGEEISRASDVAELISCIRKAPSDTLEYHALRNDFSTWLMARSEIELAASVRLMGIEDYGTVEDLRKALLLRIQSHSKVRQRGVISDYSSDGFSHEGALCRIGAGSLGGMGRGIAFLDQRLSQLKETGNYESSIISDIRIPESFVFATNNFDEFLTVNDLHDCFSGGDSDRGITERFLEAKLPSQTMDALKSVVENISYPLVVRSSSLLEDDVLHPFRGIYGSVMLANNDPDIDRRMDELSSALKMLYASTFHKKARRHMECMARRIEEEKMAVIVQRLVGRAHGDLFYPFCTGVAFSHNYYNLPPQRTGHGAVSVIFGIGPVKNRPSVRFSPFHVYSRPEYKLLSERAAFAQRNFRALDLKCGFSAVGSRPGFIAGEYSLDRADLISKSLALGNYIPGARAISIGEGDGETIVTFDGFLNLSDKIPFTETILSLLNIAVAGVGMPVEMEFCVDIDPDSFSGNIEDNIKANIYPLQIRPLVRNVAPISSENRRNSEILCRTPRSYGPSPKEDIFDIVYVRPDLSSSGKLSVEEEIAALNAKLKAEERPYILIGPGRWGKQEYSGIKVMWEQVSGAMVFVEVWPSDSNGHPVGAGFFDRISRNSLTSLVITPSRENISGDNNSILNTKLLIESPALQDFPVRHLRFTDPVLINFNPDDPGAEIFVLMPS